MIYKKYIYNRKKVLPKKITCNYLKIAVYISFFYIQGD